MKKNPYKVLGSKVVYKNQWIKVKEDKVLKPDGKEGVFGVIDYGSGVSVVALDKNNQIYLVKECYYAIEEYGLQVPSGGIDKGETPLNAAKKELVEEAGLTAGRWIELGYTNPLTMILKSPASLFLALDLKHIEKPESGIELMPMLFNKAHQMVLDSKITHAPSCISILKTKIYLDKNKIEL